ncbi:lysophospholipid acyltransferase family protein [Halocola ammonii]
MWKVINFFQILFLFLWICFCAILGVILLIPFFWKPSIGFKFVSDMWSAVIMAVVGIRLKVFGKENVPKTGGKIFVANHESHFDIPVLFASIPEPVYFIAKKELKKVPFMGWYMALLGMIFIDRSNREKAMKSMKKAGKLIKDGRSVISFPEGTRSKDGVIKMFKRGSFIIAKESNVPIVPIAVSGTWEVLAPGKSKIRPGKVKVKIGHPILPQDHPEMSPEQLAAHVRQTVIKLEESIQK